MFVHCHCLFCPIEPFEGLCSLLRSFSHFSTFMSHSISFIFSFAAAGSMYSISIIKRPIFCFASVLGLTSLAHHFVIHSRAHYNAYFSTAPRFVVSGIVCTLSLSVHTMSKSSSLVIVFLRYIHPFGNLGKFLEDPSEPSHYIWVILSFTFSKSFRVPICTVSCSHLNAQRCPDLSFLKGLH